jgi:hypothetical protein
MTEHDKKWIDEASIEDLLSRWRFAPAGDQIFQGDTGQYYKQQMAAKRAAAPAEHVAASKRIGWS